MSGDDPGDALKEATRTSRWLDRPLLGKERSSRPVERRDHSRGGDDRGMTAGAFPRSSSSTPAASATASTTPQNSAGRSRCRASTGPRRSPRKTGRSGAWNDDTARVRSASASSSFTLVQCWRTRTRSALSATAGSRRLTLCRATRTVEPDRGERRRPASAAVREWNR